MQAYVLIRVDRKGSEEVRNFLKTECRDEVKEAHVLIGGERDVIARIVVRDIKQLDDVLFRRIQAHPRVDSTATYIVAEQFED